MQKLLILLAVACFCYSSAQISIKGTVIDESSNPISFANVLVKKQSDSTLVKGSITEANGKFEMTLTAQNDYILIVSYLGYAEASFSFSESKNFGDIILKEQAEQLEGVTVTSQKPFLQREQDKLVVNVEGSIVSVGNSTMEIIEKSPGIIVDQNDNISLSGRSGVRVYIDGRDTRLQGEDLANLLRSMPSSNIEKIEIITNPSVRYEAQGNAGIINIVTKKGKFYGTNGSLTLSPGHGRYFRWNNSINANHRTEKLNIYGQYAFAKRNQYQEIVIDRAFFEEGQVVSKYDLQNDFELPLENHSGRLGLDYFLSDKTTIGVLLSGLKNINENDSFSMINGFTPNDMLISEEETKTDIKSKWNQLTGNLNMQHKFNNKSSLEINFDAARYDNSSDQRFVSNFLFTENNVQFQDILTGDVDGFLNLYGIAIDYTLPFQNKNKLEVGWKNTLVKTDNDLQYFNLANGTTTVNTDLSNHFIYDEAIYAAYISYNINKEKWNAQLGIRAENTFIKGNQLTTQESFKNDYINIFPTASYNYSFNENSVLGISVGRRIDRPSYSQLNPFRTFVNTNTYREGNPFLNPQYTWTGELNYTLKQRYYFAFNFGYTIDNLNMAILQDGNDEVVVVRPINISNLKSYSFVASVPVKFFKWWQSNWNLNASMNDFDGDIDGFNFNRNNPIVSLNSSHNLNLGNGYRLQISGFHVFPHYASVTEIETISSISIGAQKNILKNKGTVRINISDIFWNQYPTGRTRFGNIDDAFTSYRDTRYATLSFTWRFGKQTVRSERRRSSQVQDELNRARQQSNN
ncbi:outer membrane beta-barrel protein [Winogradskyella sp. 3972H.M.0a.05]|uniref:outer membrane beta-barrel protein n=1 Tax=Winogradskyella sp. 3972H.M.0a.05 TaxID=2950277 RepID=UPI0033943381